MSQPFPIQKLNPQVGTFTGPVLDCGIEIPLAPFELEGTTVSTSIRLEGILLPSDELDELVGERYDFPINPEPGYIDGSIYIEHAHHPVDATVIEFGERQGELFSIKLTLRLILEYAGLHDYVDTDVKLEGFVRPE